jgi:hypothetical protein
MPAQVCKSSGCGGEFAVEAQSLDPAREPARRGAPHARAGECVSEFDKSGRVEEQAMPVSKKPRSKAGLRTSTKTGAAAAVPDRRAMEKASWRRSADTAVTARQRKHTAQ